MYQLRYSRLYNMGNYENEKIELEEAFDESVQKADALKSLVGQVEQLHTKSAQLLQEARRAAEREQDRQSRQQEIERKRRELEALEKEHEPEPF